MSYFHDEGPWPPWNPDKVPFYERDFTLDFLHQDPNERQNSTLFDSPHMPGATAGVVDLDPALERRALFDPTTPHNPADPAGVRLRPVLVQVERTASALTDLATRLFRRSTFNQDIRQPQTLPEVAQRGTNLAVRIAAATGVSPDAVRWIALGTVLMLIPLFVRK